MLFIHKPDDGHAHVPVPAFEERKSDAAIIFAGMVCHRCGLQFSSMFPPSIEAATEDVLPVAA